MALRIPPEFERAILERVQSDMYDSTDEVLATCIEALEIEERGGDEDQDDLLPPSAAGAEEEGDEQPGEEGTPGDLDLARMRRERIKHLTLSPEFERAVLERAQSDRYASTDEVFAAFLAALERDEAQDEARLEALRAELQIGLDELDRGEGIPAEQALEMMRRWREESAA